MAAPPDDAERYTVVPRTLAFVRRGDEVLLVHRAADARILPRKYNGVGGHVEAGESLAESAEREIREETGLAVRYLEFAGVVHVTEPGAATGVLLFVFVGEADGEPSAVTREGTPRWVPLADVGALDVVPDLPAILSRLWQDGPARPFLATSKPGAAGEVRFAAP